MKKIAIVGGGLAGATAAYFLRELASVDIFEKARGLGGRLSTRRADPFTFDHGAQYFTVRTPEFAEFLEPSIKNGSIALWQGRYAKIADGEYHLYKDDTQRFVGVPGMNQVIKSINHRATCHFGIRIERMYNDGGTWQLIDAQGAVYKGYDWVIVSSPAPQAAELVPESFIHYEVLESTRLLPCLALMLGFERPLSLGFDCGHFEHSALSWVAVNPSKPGRNSSYSLVIHSTVDYASKHIDDENVSWADYLLQEASHQLSCDITQPALKLTHAWRYARNQESKKCPILIDASQKIAVCGDWTQGGRVEGAFTSALQTAQALKELF